MMMIQSFSCRETESPFVFEKTGRWSALVRVVIRKFVQLNQAMQLPKEAVTFGNLFEALKGDSFGLHSILLNERF